MIPKAADHRRSEERTHGVLLNLVVVRGGREPREAGGWLRRTRDFERK
jgi:hypothetical protein